MEEGTPTPFVERAPARVAAQSLVSLTFGTWENLLNSYKHGMSLMWNPVGCTTSEILEELGEDAAQIFALTSAVRNFANGIRPGTIPDPELPDLVFHEDGRVSLAPPSEPDPVD